MKKQLVNVALEYVTFAPQAAGKTTFIYATALAGDKKMGGFNRDVKENFYIDGASANRMIAKAREVIKTTGIAPTYSISQMTFPLLIKDSRNINKTSLCEVRFDDAPGGDFHYLSNIEGYVNDADEKRCISSEFKSVYKVAIISLEELANSSNCPEFNPARCSITSVTNCKVFKSLSVNGLRSANCEFYNKFAVRSRLENIARLPGGTEKMVVVITHGADANLENARNGTLIEQCQHAREIVERYLRDICHGGHQPPVFVVDSLEAMTVSNRKSYWLDDVSAPFLYCLHDFLSKAKVEHYCGFVGAVKTFLVGDSESNLDRAISLSNEFLQRSVRRRNI